MHCHHYNINLQKTLEDTLGDEGIQLIVRSAEESSFNNFRNLADQLAYLKTVKSKLEMAASMYLNYGLGIIHLQEIDMAGGRITSPSSHHVTGWMAKHGRRTTPGCHFTRGWIAGVLAVIFDKPVGHYQLQETHCKMVGDSECVFLVSPKLG